jgi:uncharacterized membrane protein
MYSHITKCFLAGLVAILPIGGLILLVVHLDRGLRPLVKDTIFDFFGMSIIVAAVAIYLLGLIVTTFIGRWLWGLIDGILSRLPGLAMLYNTLKQILGYGDGKDALFRQVVFIKDHASGTLELGLVTEELNLKEHGHRMAIFLPGSPNPMLGKMVLVEPHRVIPTQIPVDVALKALLSTGKTGL